MNESNEEQYKGALEAAAEQLSYRALSTQGLREKLQVKFSEDAVEYVVAWFIERGLLDDSAFADATVRSYGRRGYGQLRIRQELRKRGVEKDMAEDALSNFAANREVMRTLLEKRLHGELSDRRQVQKAVAALQRRGFLWEDIRIVLNEYGASVEESFE